MSYIKYKFYRVKKYFQILGLILLSSNSYSMLCPSNYNTIEFGFTMDKILELCGAPAQKSEYKETISLSAGQSTNQFSGIYSQNSAYYSSQGQGGSQQLNDIKEKVIIHTKFIYTGLQPTELIFEDGVLTNRQLLTK